MLIQIINYKTFEIIFEWYKNSSVGQYTNYYDKLIFHTREGIEAAYKDDLSNYWKI